MIRKLILIGALAVPLLFSSSCSVFIVKALGLTEEEVEEIVLVNGERKIVFFPMHHIGVAEFYEDISTKVDSLNGLGYIGFYESVEAGDLDSLEERELRLKFRKITGISKMKEESYISMLGRLGAQDIIDKYKLVDQPSYYQMGVDTSSAVHADLPMDVLIQEFEQDNGDIELNYCDSTTAFEEEYKCEKLSSELRKRFMKYYILGMRDKKIAETVQEVNASKIYIIYGARHFDGFLDELNSLDPGWVEQ